LERGRKVFFEKSKGVKPEQNWSEGRRNSKGPPPRGGGGVRNSVEKKDPKGHVHGGEKGSPTAENLKMIRTRQTLGGTRGNA